MWTKNFKMYKLSLEKGGEAEIKLATFPGSQRKQGNSRKTSASLKFLKMWEYQTTLPASWETYMQVQKQQLAPDMEQQTGSKLGKEFIKAR